MDTVWCFKAAIWGPSGKNILFTPAWLMFWCGWCFSTVYFLKWSMFKSGWCLRSLREYRSPTLILVGQGKNILKLAGPSGQFNLVWSMFRFGRCFGEVDVSKRLIFEVPQGKYILKLAGPLGQFSSIWSMFRCSRCFGVVDVSVWSMFQSGWCLRSLRVKIYQN